MRKAVLWVSIAVLVVSLGKISIDQYSLFVARDAVRSKLTDPDSALFRNEIMLGGILSGIVCGEVNAKNKMGGYVGYTEFFVVISKLKALDFAGEISRDRLSADHVREVCSKASDVG